MKSEYLQEASEIMSRCLVYGGDGVTFNQRMSPGSLAIYLAVACTALGEPSTGRWITGHALVHANKMHAETEAALEARATTLIHERLISLMEGILDLQARRSSIIEAGMPDAALQYIMQDSRIIVRHLLRSERQPVDTLFCRFGDLTTAVCVEAKHTIASVQHSRNLERAGRVIFGAAARITAAKLSGGVSEILNALGEISIERGLES